MDSAAELDRLRATMTGNVTQEGVAASHLIDAEYPPTDTLPQLPTNSEGSKSDADTSLIGKLKKFLRI